MTFAREGNPGLSDGLAKEIRAANPTVFDPETPPARDNQFINDLLYHREYDAVNSMHNALVNPDMYVPMP